MIRFGRSHKQNHLQPRLIGKISAYKKILGRVRLDLISTSKWLENCNILTYPHLTKYAL